MPVCGLNHLMKKSLLVKKTVITLLIILLAGYLTLSSGITQNLGSYVYVDIRFLSWQAMAVILFSSTFLGWFGCYLSLKQILK